MRNRLVVLMALMSVASPPLLLLLDGCTVAPELAFFDCDPDARFPDPMCIPEAGPDADADGDVDFQTPGSESQANTCFSGRCVPAPHGSEAGSWSEIPLLVWFGPPADAPEKCPPDIAPNEKFRRFEDLVAPPASCDVCACEESTGTCTGLPGEIKIQAGMCKQGGLATVPFDGPAGWDGSCTSVNALPDGAKCPEGSSTLCAQSVEASALPAPTEESCGVKTQPAPKPSTETHWNIAALACHANTREDECGSTSEYCVNDLPLPWLQCVYRAGVHEACPSNYAHSRHVTYPEEPIDDRTCTDCACGAPEGSSCLASLRLYEDAACTAQFAVNPISSTGEQCGNVFPAGRALGSKAITDLSYLPGQCAASGGAPVGGAHPDVSGAVTFCCLPPFDILK
jgi:hypothetical protein